MLCRDLAGGLLRLPLRLPDQVPGVQITKARENGVSQAEIDKQQAQDRRFIELYNNPIVNFGMTILEPLPVGVVLALVSAGVLSRRRKSAIGLAGASQSA